MRTAELDRASTTNPHQNRDRIRQAKAKAMEKRNALSLSIQDNEKKLVAEQQMQFTTTSR